MRHAGRAGLEHGARSRAAVDHRGGHVARRPPRRGRPDGPARPGHAAGPAVPPAARGVTGRAVRHAPVGGLRVRPLDAPAADRRARTRTRRARCSSSPGRGHDRVRPAPAAVGHDARRGPGGRPRGPGDEAPPLADRRSRRACSSACCCSRPTPSPDRSRRSRCPRRPRLAERARAWPARRWATRSPRVAGTARGGLGRRGAGRPRTVVRHPVRSALDVVATASSLGRFVTPVSDTLSPIMTGRGLGRHLDMIEVDLDRPEAAGAAVGGDAQRRLRGLDHRRAAPLPRAARCAGRRTAGHHAHLAPARGRPGGGQPHHAGAVHWSRWVRPTRPPGSA